MSSTMYSGSTLKDMGTSLGNGNLQLRTIKKVSLSPKKKLAHTRLKDWDVFS